MRLHELQITGHTLQAYNYTLLVFLLGSKSDELNQLQPSDPKKLITKKTFTIPGFQLLGLLPGTTYHVRAALKNAAAVGDFSAPIIVTTYNSSGKQSRKNLAINP